MSHTPIILKDQANIGFSDTDYINFVFLGADAAPTVTNPRTAPPLPTPRCLHSSPSLRLFITASYSAHIPSALSSCDITSFIPPLLYIATALFPPHCVVGGPGRPPAMSGLRLTEGSRGPGATVAVEGAPLTRTQIPYVTGSSVLGIKCADGVVIACDTMGTLGGRGGGAGEGTTSGQWVGGGDNWGQHARSSSPARLCGLAAAAVGVGVFP